MGEQLNLSDSDWMFLGRVLEPYFAEGYPDDGMAAEICGTQVRTLRRRLRKAAISYREIVVATRLRIAERLLADPGMRLIDIAYCCT